VENEDDECDEEDAGENAAECDCFVIRKGRGGREGGEAKVARFRVFLIYGQPIEHHLREGWTPRCGAPRLTGRDVYGWVHAVTTK